MIYNYWFFPENFSLKIKTAYNSFNFIHASLKIYDLYWLDVHQQYNALGIVHLENSQYGRGGRSNLDRWGNSDRRVF